MVKDSETTDKLASLTIQELNESMGKNSETTDKLSSLTIQELNEYMKATETLLKWCENNARLYSDNVSNVDRKYQEMATKFQQVRIKILNEMEKQISVL